MMSEQQVIDVCRIGRGEACCRFLVRGPEGWGCAKLTELREYIDGRDTAIARNGEGQQSVPI